jgi:hypothetical protein
VKAGGLKQEVDHATEEGEVPEDDLEEHQRDGEERSPPKTGCGCCTEGSQKIWREDPEERKEEMTTSKKKATPKQKEPTPKEQKELEDRYLTKKRDE